MKLLMLCGASPDERELAEGHLAAQSAMVPWLHAETKVVGLGSWEEYNRWFVGGMKCPEVDESGFDFILNIEPDASIANPKAWSDRFLAYDYMGAPWRARWKTLVNYARRHGRIPDRERVGNSGFCLISRKLVDTLRRRSPAFLDYGGGEVRDPCDWYLFVAKAGVLWRSGIKVAPPLVAGKFAVERDRYDGQFGVHNWVSVAGRQISLKENRYHTFKELSR